MSEYRRGLPQRPRRMLDRPLDDKGYPVPWFVATVDGKPDHRIVGDGKMRDAVRHKKCWCCGEPLGAYTTFLIGPMCVINRVSAEPPMHADCAAYAAQACPFLTWPNAKRREAGLPDDAKPAAGGEMITRNPGVVALYTTKRFDVMNIGGLLFRLGKPNDVTWIAEGRIAERDEIMQSIESGAPTLEQSARDESEEALAMFHKMKADAIALVPEV